MNTNPNFIRFLEKDEEIRTECKLAGKDDITAEREVAQYFEMDISGYRKARGAALKARRAQQVFTVSYYMATHADANTSVIAERLGLPEVIVKAAKNAR
jgi:hypothetical protein